MSEEHPPGGPPAPAARLSDARRDRLRRAQLVSAQAARARAAGGAPDDGEAARLVAEFHARGGQVTVCPPAEDPVTGPAPNGTRPPGGDGGPR